MGIGEFSRRRLYTGLRLDYTLGLWVPTSASHAISAVAEILVVTWVMWSCRHVDMTLCQRVDS